MKQNYIREYSYDCGCSFRVEVRYDTGWALAGAHSYTQLSSCGDSENCGGAPTLHVAAELPHPHHQDDSGGDGEDEKGEP